MSNRSVSPMRYRLRTLLIVLAMLAVGWWKYAEWKAKQERLRAFREIETLNLPVYPYPSLRVGRQAQKASPDEH